MVSDDRFIIFSFSKISWISWKPLNIDSSTRQIEKTIERFATEQKITNKEQLEQLKKIVATGAAVVLTIGLIVSRWNHYQNKKILEQQQREQQLEQQRQQQLEQRQQQLEEQQREQQERVKRTKTTEVIRNPDGGATFREIITDERPVGDNQDTADNENSTMLLALREFTRPVDQGQGHNMFPKTIILGENPE